MIKYPVFVVVLDLCCNQLTGNIPAQMGSLKKLNRLVLQYNRLNESIPSNLGSLSMLKRLDLSFNYLSGTIPSRLASIPQLEALDVRNNSLSGIVPPGMFFHSKLSSQILKFLNQLLCVSFILLSFMTLVFPFWWIK